MLQHPFPWSPLPRLFVVWLRGPPRPFCFLFPVFVRLLLLSKRLLVAQFLATCGTRSIRRFCARVVRIASNRRGFGSTFLVPFAELLTGLLHLSPSGSFLPTIPGFFQCVVPVPFCPGCPFSLLPFVYRPSFLPVFGRALLSKLP